MSLVLEHFAKGVLNGRVIIVDEALFAQADCKRRFAFCHSQRLAGAMNTIARPAYRQIDYLGRQFCVAWVRALLCTKEWWSHKNADGWLCANN